MAYGDFKDLGRRTVSEKVLRDKAFNIVKKTTYDRYQRGWLRFTNFLMESLLQAVVSLIMTLNKTYN